ncbi:MAG: phosphoglycerate dehydrogenase [Candidatus Marinimicrobia bacterium]|nr:phosphoglycerate dehydrogenase [Candidatus Neomarinimicrobiota bacterium]
MSKVLITTIPFADKDRLPLELLENNNIEYLINPLGKKLTEDELTEMITDFDVIIAGTETISSKVMDRANNLKMISRVGIGLDSVDLLAAKERDIMVSYTPDAPSPAVAELTIGLIFSLLRSIHLSNSQLHQGKWHRFFGRRLSEVTLGIIGVGRIGGRVLRRTKPFGTPKLLVNDIDHSKRPELVDFKLDWASKEKIYEEADIISIHTPLTIATKNMVTKRELLKMKKDAIIINTARGGIVNEHDLYEVMKSGHLSGAAIDVFEKEPYDGNLREIERCILTAHMGSMSDDCRTRMEIEATEEAVRFLTGKNQERKVPQEEYDVQSQGL